MDRTSSPLAARAEVFQLEASRAVRRTARWILMATLRGIDFS